jgi:hypothetical protein
MQENIQQVDDSLSVSDVVENMMELVISYAGTTDDWLLVKRELLVLLPNHERQRFSRRHAVTKQQTINEYEKILIDMWFEMTGARLMIHER